MLTVEDESISVEVYEDNVNNVFIKLQDLKNEILDFVFLSSTKNCLIVINENLKGKLLRRVYRESLKIINCDLSLLNYRANIITEDNFKSNS